MPHPGTRIRHQETAMRQQLHLTRLDRRARRLEQAATTRQRPRPSARDHYSTAALVAGLRG